MRTCWEALHSSLVHSVDTLEAHQQFNDEKRRRPELRPFESPGALLDFLATDDDGDRDQKDRIYAGLVETVQAQEERATLAMALLFLGLWPALDRLYRRHLHHHPDIYRWHEKRHDDDPDKLVSEVWACFTTAVHRAELGRIRRVAVTLVKNTRRTIWDAQKRVWAEQGRSAELPADDALPEPESPRVAGTPSDLGVLPWMTADEEIQRLRAVITEVVGADADLVIGKVLYGVTQREMAEQLGINSGSQPLTSGRGGFGFSVRDVTRRGFFDHLELYRQV